MSTIQPFRLLDLPREIRDAIYHATLCEWPCQGLFRHSIANTPDRQLRLEVMAQKVEPNILRANRMIYQEAKQVFLKGNKFVYIQMVARNPTLLSGAFVRSQIPVVATGLDNVVLFKDLVVMKHLVKFAEDPGSSPRVRLDAIILHQDLTEFCKALALVDVHSRRFAGQSSHRITILNPFATTLSPDFLNPKNQERLFKPQCTRLHGFDHVKIRGSVDGDLAQAVVRAMKRQPALPSPIKLLEKLISWNGRGKKALPRNRRAWPGFVEATGRDYTDHLSDVAFQIQSNRAQAYLQVAQTGLLGDDPEGPFMTWMTQVFSACSDAMQMGKILGTDWTASDDQQATLFYRWAQAHRLAEEDVHFAENVIRRAAQLRPGDQEIRSEMRRILDWKASVGLP